MATQPIEQPTVPEAVIGTEIQSEPPRDYEAEARKGGWRPEEEWPADKPRPREFKDAETFVRDSEEKAGLQRKTIAHLTEKVRFLERQVKRVVQSEQNAYANALSDLKAQQLRAVEVGDVKAFEALDEKADKLRKDMAADADPAHGENPVEELATFREDNPWFDKANLASASEIEVEARLFADRLADKWIAQGLPKEIPPSEFYRRLAAEVKEKFPTLGRKTAAPKPPSDVAPVTPRVPPRNARTGANLPAEAKATAERYMRQKIPGYSACKSKDEAYNLFAQSYEWE